MNIDRYLQRINSVAALRGQRGLKFYGHGYYDSCILRRCPSWAAWIEIAVVSCIASILTVAALRGQRGLKLRSPHGLLEINRSLPFVGSVD